MDFSEQYKSPKWQKKRLEIFERDNYTCVECGSKEKTLHVHHVYYSKLKKIWEYENEFLKTLCDDCHSDIHEAKGILKESIDIGFTTIDEINVLQSIVETVYSLTQMERDELNIALGIYSKEVNNNERIRTIKKLV